jgi:predicted transcriptional regulator
MPKEAMFSLKLDAALHEAFMAEAQAVDRPASQIVREFMREFVEKRQKDRDYDAWFRAEVEAGLREADDPNAVWLSNEEVMAHLEARKQELLKRIARETDG